MEALGKSGKRVNYNERSLAPMILGIIGGIIGLPGAVCAGACVQTVGTFAESSSSEVNEMTGFYMGLALVGALGGLIASCFSRRYPTAVGILMIVFALIGGITIITSNLFAIPTAILFVVGGAISIAQRNKGIIG